jgi:predicted ABC-type ATPase
MSADSNRLDEETHARIFREKIAPRSALNRSTPQDAPRAVITAGQPGAGTGVLVEAAKAELGGDVVIVDPDELHDYHPDLIRLRQLHPYRWFIETDADACRWAAKLRDLAIEGRRHIILDTTLADADPVIEQIRAMQAKGYEVEIRVIAAHRLESELRIDRRFTDSLMENGYGRHVPGEIHDQAYEALPANLDRVLEETGVRMQI